MIIRNLYYTLETTSLPIIATSCDLANRKSTHINAARGETSEPPINRITARLQSNVARSSAVAQLLSAHSPRPHNTSTVRTHKVKVQRIREREINRSTPHPIYIYAAVIRSAGRICLSISTRSLARARVNG